MKTIFFYPYVGMSKGLANVVKAMNTIQPESAKIIRVANSKFRATQGKVVGNWGSSNDRIHSIATKVLVLNHPDAVATCANKLSFFRAIEGACSHPPFTTDRVQAQDMLAEGPVVSRTTLNGHSGEGIVINEDPTGEVVNARLYVKYIPKKEEYRVHVFRGQVIDVQQKLLRTEDDQGKKVDPKDVNWRVRSYTNGFIFARQAISPPKAVTDEAVKAFKRINELDFGAIDVIYNQKQNRAYVLECNTAPGVMNTTAERYARGFIEALKEVS